MASVADILARKGRRVVAVGPTATVLEATQLMNQHRIGALVVTPGVGEDADCDRVMGMFTERDVLTRVVGQGRDPATTRVEEVMTADVAYCRSEMELEEVGAVMVQRRIRHLPVCDGEGKLSGMVSIGDLNAWHAQGQDIEIHYLHEYIHGRV